MYKGKQETDEDYGLGPDKSLSVPEFPTDLDNFASSHLKVKRKHFLKTFPHPLVIICVRNPKKDVQNKGIKTVLIFLQKLQRN